MTILISGFEPFNKHNSNPSSLLLPILKKRHPQIKTIELPVTYSGAWRLLKQKVHECSAQKVICLGLSEARHQISIERVALNLIDANIVDNEGKKYQDQPIVNHAPMAYWATFPTRQLLEVLKSNQIEASLSESAGTFVCNHLFYNLCHEIASQKINIQGGFIHLPLESKMPLQTQQKAISLMINYLS